MQAMAKDTLKDFIAHARKKEMDHATIRLLLQSHGWKERDIMRAMTDQELDMPVPLPPDTGGAREAFFHLLRFGALYTMITSSILLLFSYINRLFPDVAIEGGYYQSDSQLDGIRWGMACIIADGSLISHYSLPPL